MILLQLDVPLADDVESRILRTHVPQSPVKNNWTMAEPRYRQDQQFRCVFAVEREPVGVQDRLMTQDWILLVRCRSLQRGRISCDAPDFRRRQRAAEES